MRKTFISIIFVCSTAICSNIFAQGASTPGSGDKDLRDTNVKSRSIDLERVNRDARRTDKSAANPAMSPEDRLAAKYVEIKTDYEQIQLSQDAIIKAYKSGVKIDYAQIGKSALEINESATRLKLNLFFLPPFTETDTKKEVQKEVKKPGRDTSAAKSVRDLIVDLDNSIGSFAGSPMFRNLRTIDAKISAKAELDLKQVIESSRLLGAEAEKMKKAN